MKGISPVVAVVLLIAIAVITAVGVYFWTESLTSKQATPESPIPISAETIDFGCNYTGDNDSITVVIRNLDRSREFNETLFLRGDNGVMQTEKKLYLSNGGQDTITFVSDGEVNLTYGRVYTIYGKQGMGSASIFC